MSIDTKHPAYTEHLPDWEDARNFYAGSRRVKDLGERYLPATDGMRIDGLGSNAQGKLNVGQEAYDAYRKRARVPNYVKEAVEAIVGLLHQKDAIVELPAQLEYLRSNASVKGESLAALMRRISVEQITTGRLGLLVDMPKKPDPSNPNPRIALYSAESIINWDDDTETDEDDNTEAGEFPTLNLVVLDESGRNRINTFTWEEVKKYRVLTKDSDSNYVSGIFSSVKGSPTFNEQALSALTLRGQTLDFIPFVFINSKDVLADPDETPLKGLIELSIGIYQSEADYQQNLHMQSQETLVVIGGVRNPTGIPGEPEALRVGAGSRIDIDQGGDAKYIGVSANGLAEQRAAIEADRRRAQIQAGELIQNSGSQMESGQALSTRFNAQTATLNQLATTAASGIELSLKQIAVWIGADPAKVKVTPNTEFIDFNLDGANIKALTEAKNEGFPISEESLHALAADRGLTTMDFITEMKKVEEDRKAAQKRKEDALKMESELALKPTATGAPGAKPPVSSSAQSPANK